MKIFLDTANIIAVMKYADLVDGITTNPMIMAKEKVNQEQRLLDICKYVPTLPVSGEVIYDHSVEQIIEDARKIRDIFPNIVVKIPGSMTGMATIKFLKSEGIKINVTALMTYKQLALASLLGADYVSQFFCRARDAGLDSVKEINLAKEFIEKNNLKTQIIVGSLRKVSDVEEALMTRADILTIVPELINESFTHSKTEASIQEFARKYEETEGVYIKSEENFKACKYIGKVMEGIKTS
jgi:transaldolase